MKFSFPAYLKIESSSDDVVRKSILFAKEAPETSIKYLFDERYISDIESVIGSIIQHPVSTIFVVGIGGANLATKAFYDAHVGFVEGIRNLTRRMIFLDTNNSDTMAAVEDRITTISSIEDFLVIIVSKSGKTIETLANTEFLLHRLEQSFQEVSSRILVVSSASSALFKEATEKGIKTVSLPEQLSDRFSAFSPTTIVPLLAFGFSVKEFLSFAKSAYSKLQDGDEVMKSVSLLNAAYKDQKHIFDLFFFSSRYETLAKWHRQLVAESLGKSTNHDGKKVVFGFTPTISMGTTDLHSVLQLNLAGPKERVTEFVSVEYTPHESVGDSKTLDLLPQGITQKNAEEITGVILDSVKNSYQKEDLPFFEIELSYSEVKAIAEYMVFAMLQTIALGDLWDVTVFDQPNVEEYKNAARETLER